MSTPATPFRDEAALAAALSCPLPAAMAEWRARAEDESKAFALGAREAYVRFVMGTASHVQGHRGLPVFQHQSTTFVGLPFGPAATMRSALDASRASVRAYMASSAPAVAAAMAAVDDDGDAKMEEGGATYAVVGDSVPETAEASAFTMRILQALAGPSTCFLSNVTSRRYKFDGTPASSAECGINDYINILLGAKTAAGTIGVINAKIIELLLKGAILTAKGHQLVYIVYKPCDGGMAAALDKLDEAAVPAAVFHWLTTEKKCATTFGDDNEAFQWLMEVTRATLVLNDGGPQSLNQVMLALSKGSPVQCLITERHEGNRRPFAAAELVFMLQHAAARLATTTLSRAQRATKLVAFWAWFRATRAVFVDEGQTTPPRFLFKVTPTNKGVDASTKLGQIKQAHTLMTECTEDILDALPAAQFKFIHEARRKEVLAFVSAMVASL